MEASGALAGKRYELIEGVLIDKMGQNPPHWWSIGLVNQCLGAIFGWEALISQLPIEAASEDNERSLPEPDVAVLGKRSPEYATRFPRGGELLLVVEVADSSLLADLTVKAGIYARADVPDYWVLDIPGRGMVVHRDPKDGVYRSVVRYGEPEAVAPLARPASSVAVASLLPPVPGAE